MRLSVRLFFCLLVAYTWSLPVPEPSEGKDYTTNEGWQLLKNVGDLYLIDLTPQAGQHQQYQPFETSFSRKMTGTDKDTVLLTLSGSDSSRDDVFTAIMDVMARRYEARMLKIDNLKDTVKNSEAALWFFLYGAASTTAGQTQSIDEAVGKLLDLAQLAIKGKPFYPKQTVLDLMEGSLKKMNPDLAPLMRKLGYIIIEKGVRHQSPSSTAVDIHKDDFFVSAEYFQLWTELSVFVFSHMPRDNVLLQPMTLVATDSLNVVVQNINLPTGGPLLLHQFEAILGFLEAKRQQLLPANLADARIKADYQAFFAGFCKQQVLQQGAPSEDEGSGASAGGRRLFLGKRNVNSAIRAQEFRYLSEAFRALQTSVAQLSSKFARAADVGVLRTRPDDFSEYDRFDLISETYLAQTNDQVVAEEEANPALGEL